MPLLLAHDGPEYDALSSLTRYAGAMIERGTLAAVSRRAAAARRPRRVVFGLGGLRSRALSPDHPGGARPGRRGRSAGGDGRQPGRARDAPGAAELAGAVRRPVPAVWELLHAALRSPRVGVPAVRSHHALRRRRAARAAGRRSGASDDDVRRRGGEHPQQPRDVLIARRPGLSRASRTRSPTCTTTRAGATRSTRI